MKLHSILALVLSTSLLIMPFVMDYAAEANVLKFKERAESLRSVNAWFPVSHFDGIEKKLPPNVMWLWQYLGFLKEDFFGLLRANGMWSDAPKAKWGPIFTKWAYPNAEIMQHGFVEHGSSHFKMKWVNFYVTPDASPDPFYNGTSGITSPVSFLIPNKEDRFAHHGFVFLDVAMTPVYKAPMCLEFTSPEPRVNSDITSSSSSSSSSSCSSSSPSSSTPYFIPNSPSDEFGKRVLSVDETVRLQARLQLSGTGLRDARKEFIANNFPLKLAPESKVNAWVRARAITASHIEGAALVGKNGSVSCLVYHVHSAADAAARDLDLNFKTHKPCKFQCDDTSELPVMSFMFMNDWGGKSDKHVLRLLDVPKSNSPNHCTIIGSAETMRPDDTMKPSGCWENFSFVLDLIDGLVDFETNLILQLGEHHLLFPRHTQPGTWAWQPIPEAERGAFFSCAYGTGSTVAEKAACRAALPGGCATLIVIGSSCLGIRTGSVTFPFRAAVEVDVSGAPSPVLFATSLYLSADLLALCVFIGNQGQAGCSCPFCRCNAPRFKKMAADASVECELRTAATQKADFDSFRATDANINNFNGVSFPSLFPNIPFRRIIPPVLHLVLGLVNDQMQYMWKELTVWDGADPAYAKELSVLTDDVEDAELEVARCIAAAVEYLPPRDPVVSSVIGKEEPGIVVSQADDLDIFQPLVDALEEAAKAKLDEAHAIETAPPRNGLSSGHSGRARTIAAAKAAKIRTEAHEISDTVTALSTALASLVGARVLLQELIASAEGEECGSTCGVLTAALKGALQFYCISMQRYWNGTLVGPDVRKLLRVYQQVLRIIADKMAEIHGDAEATRFFDRYSSVFKHLDIISHLTRSTLEGREHYGRYTEEQVTALGNACTGFGDAFRVAHGRMLTVKGHIVEKHVPEYARMYGVLGIFGEDGLEALHPLDSRCRLITRTMRNPKGRLIATTKFMEMAKHGKGKDLPKRKRRRSEAAAAAESSESEGEDAELPDAQVQDDGEGDDETPAELLRIAEVRDALAASDAAPEGR